MSMRSITLVGWRPNIMSIYPSLHCPFPAAVGARAPWQIVDPSTEGTNQAIGILDTGIGEMALEMSLQGFGIFKWVVAESIKMSAEEEEAAEDTQRKHVTALISLIWVGVGDGRHLSEISGTSDSTMDRNIS